MTTKREGKEKKKYQVDATLYEEKRVLTSQSIQECYMLVKRKPHVDQLLKDELCLLKVQEEEPNAPEVEVVAAETDENRLLMPQRKEKERKGKKRREKKRRGKQRK